MQIMLIVLTVLNHYSPVNIVTHLYRGDCNTSFEQNNAQTECLNNFIERNNLVVSWNHPVSKKDHTYTRGCASRSPGWQVELLLSFQFSICYFKQRVFVCVRRCMALHTYVV